MVLLYIEMLVKPEEEPIPEQGEEIKKVDIPEERKILEKWTIYDGLDLHIIKSNQNYLPYRNEEFPRRPSKTHQSTTS